MYCSNCGHKNQDNDRFCRQCGTPLEEPIIPNSVNDQLIDSSKTEFSSQSFLNQPTQLMNSNEPDSNQSLEETHPTDTSDSKISFDKSIEKKTKVESLEDLPEVSSLEEKSFIKPNNPFPNDLNFSSPPKPSKKGKFIGIGLGCIVLGIIVGGGAYFFVNGGEVPFIDSMIHLGSSEESNEIKIVQEGEENSSLKMSSENETGFRISIYSSSSQNSSNKSTSSSSKETASSSQPIKVQSLDPWTGKYRTDYVMKVRKEPSYEGERIGRKEKNEVFEVVKSEFGSNNSVWGQLPDGGWICLKDDDLVYAREID